MDNLYNQKVMNVNNVFSDSFMDTKMLYLYCFNALPSINYIGLIDGEKAFASILEKFGEKINADRYNHEHEKRRNVRNSIRVEFPDF